MIEKFTRSGGRIGRFTANASAPRRIAARYGPRGPGVTELEAAFLAEMLSYAGLGSQEGSFSGGAGEVQFASFLRDEQARQMARQGGIGLAEQIFHSLKQREGQR